MHYYETKYICSLDLFSTIGAIQYKYSADSPLVPLRALHHLDLDKLPPENFLIEVQSNGTKGINSIFTLHNMSD